MGEAEYKDETIKEKEKEKVGRWGTGETGEEEEEELWPDDLHTYHWLQADPCLQTDCEARAGVQLHLRTTASSSQVWNSSQSQGRKQLPRGWIQHPEFNGYIQSEALCSATVQ